MKNYPRNSYDSFNSSTPYEKKQLHTSVLCSGSGYQRRVNMGVVKQIVSEFDPKLFDEIIVSYREGRYHVVDGQHRIAGVKLMNGGADCLVPCKILYGLTYEQEADLYARLDRCRKQLRMADKTRAVAEAGSDEDINKIKKILAHYNFTWTFTGAHGNENTVGAARAVLNAYNLLGTSGFAQMIRLLRATWNGDGNSINSYMLSGMALFIKTYGGEIDEAHFVNRLSKVSPKEIVIEGKADISTRVTALKYARVIRNKYNFRTMKNPLPYRFGD